MGRTIEFMKTKLLGYWNYSGILLALALPTGAAPLQRSDVIKDPMMVIHLDCDALRETGLGKFVLAEMDKPEAKQQLAGFQTIFNIDPRKDLHGLTAYGISEKQEEGVLLIYADFDTPRLTTLAEGAKDHRAITHGKYTIHSWIDEKREAAGADNARTYAVIRNKVLIFGQKEDRVSAALDVCDGTNPSLSKSETYKGLAAPGTGMFFQAAATKIPNAKSDPAAVALKQASFYALTASESENKAVATLTLMATSSDVAKQIQSVGQGLLGLLALQTQNPDAVKLSQAVVVKQEGRSVVAKLTLPVDDVLAMIKAKIAK